MLSLSLPILLHVQYLGGVVAYPVMQAYGSLALVDNLEVVWAEAGCRFDSYACTSLLWLPIKETDPQLAMGPSERGLSDFPYLLGGGSPVRFLEGPIAKRPGMVLGYLLMISQPILSA